MTDKWKVCTQPRPITTGHGESEKLVKLEHPKIPCAIYVGECWGNPDIQNKLAEHLAGFLNQ